MQEKEYFDKINTENFVPLTDNRVMSMDVLITRIINALRIESNKENIPLLEELIDEIDAEVIISAQWISKNKTPKSCWLDSFMHRAKTLGLYKREIQFLSSLSHTDSFNEARNFYGNLGNKRPSEDFNEGQYIEFLQNFDGTIKSEISFFENEFDNVNKNDVYDYFYAALVSKNYLNETDFKKYLKLAFHNKKPPKVLSRFNGKPKKASIRKVFRDYQYNVSKEQLNKDSYVALLSNYFEGFKFENTKTNWAK